MSSDIKIECFLPSAANLLRKYVEGKSSIVGNLPTPTIHKGPGTSAYIRLSDALSVYLPFGIELDAIVSVPTESPKVVKSYWDSRAARKAIRELPPSAKNNLKVLISEWADGADPNGQTKKNRGSVHVITMSLLNDDIRNSENHTFVLALSREKDDHEGVRRVLYEDVKNLETEGSIFLMGLKM